MEKHCVSLGIAKQLKEAGWNKDAVHYWVKERGLWRLENEKHYINGCSITKFINDFPERCPAPLATEILEELPRFLGNSGLYELTITHKNYGKYCVSYYDDGNESSYSEEQFDESLPNALAKMWLYLKKEGKV